jgi:transposase-like protein
VLRVAVETADMTQQPSFYHRHRFPAEIISYDVWMYHLFTLSLRDIGLLLAGTAQTLGDHAALAKAMSA